ncbi:MAG: hypothetical protein VX642_10690 [Bdellovibrionota bacterium]|nr:hypothetical protein [Bdellovibrionota bacterium]
MFKTYLLCLTLSLGLNVFAGSESNNTSFYYDEIFSLSTIHPEQEELLKRLDAVELPVKFKAKIRKDLTDTLVQYSSEDFSYKDFLTNIKMKLVEKEKTTTIVDGKLMQTLRERWVPIEEVVDYGIYPNLDDKIKTKNKEETPLAAISMGQKVKVVYFSKVIKKMTQKERIELVLHEQAHRLPFLIENIHHDERTIRAWANSFYSYLYGRMTKDEFFKILNSFNIETSVINERENECAKGQCFDEEIYLKNGEFAAYLPFVLTKDNLIYHGVSSDLYLIVIDTKSLNQYPVLKDKEQLEFTFKISSPEEYQDAVRSFSDIASGKTEHQIELLISYIKNTYQLEDGSYITKYDRPIFHYSNPAHRQVEKTLKSTLDLQKYNIKIGQNWAYPLIPNNQLSEKVRFIENATQSLYATMEELRPAEIKLFLKAGGKINYKINRNSDEPFFSISLNDNELKETNYSEFNIRPRANQLTVDISINLEKALENKDFIEVQKKSIQNLSKVLKNSIFKNFLDRTTVDFLDRDDAISNTHHLLRTEKLRKITVQLLYTMYLTTKNMNYGYNRNPIYILDKDCLKGDLFSLTLYNNKNSNLHTYICAPNAVLADTSLLEEALTISLSADNYVRLNGIPAYIEHYYSRSKKKFIKRKRKTKNYEENSKIAYYGFEDFWKNWFKVKNMTEDEILEIFLN